MEEINVKRLAAEKAVEQVEDGMVVGLGTGSTAYWAILKLASRIKEGLNIKAVATSNRSEELARDNGIPIVSFSEISQIDIDIDGADEVDDENNLIKGGGGALLREKIIASNSTIFLVVVDESKIKNNLGNFPLPVEIIPFAENLTLQKLVALGCKPVIRTENNHQYITDNGNLIADCQFDKISAPEDLNRKIHMIPGVVETGLFTKTMVHKVIIGYKNGIVEVR